MAPVVLVAFTVIMLSAMTRVGASTSRTVIDCFADAVLPDASVAVQVIVVRPTMNGSPGAAPSLREDETFTSGQLSAACAVPVDTTAEGRCRSLPVEMPSGATIDGFSLSFTVIV